MTHGAELVAVALCLLPAMAAAQSVPLAKWEECMDKLTLQGNPAWVNASDPTHSILDILTGRYTDEFGGGVAPKFLELLEKASLEAQQAYAEFELAKEGWTAIIPSDTFMNKSTNIEVDTYAFYGIDIDTISTEDATRVVLSHLIPDTLRYADANNAANATGPFTLTALSGYEWTFAYAGVDQPWLVILDPTVVASGSSDAGSYFNIQMDITNIDGDKCPNTVIQVFEPAFIVDPVEVTPEPPVPISEPPTGPPLFAPTPSPPAPPTPVPVVIPTSATSKTAFFTAVVGILLVLVVL